MKTNFAAVGVADLDLARASVFIDFDGTISTADVGMHLLDRTASPAWWELHDRYERGEIGSRECVAAQWALVDGDEASLRSIAAEVALDPAFEPLVRGLRALGAEVTVVSDGFGFYVDDACSPLGITVITNAIDFTSGELAFPHEDQGCSCALCGVCKQAPIRDASRRGKTTVLIGDGASDRMAASVADVVFAKGPLTRWCQDAGVACIPFETLIDVLGALCG